MSIERNYQNQQREGGSEKEILREICLNELRNLESKNRLYVDKNEYIARFEKEFKVFESSGYISIILIIADYINWAKNNGIVVGPGRGSAAGSLVVYLSGITSIDPLRFNLLFERFLNPERVSQPDIDTDFSDRDAVISYLRDHYGNNRIAKVGVPSLFKPRSAIDEFARGLGVSFDETKKITKLIGDSKTFDEAFAEQPILEQYEKQYPEMFDYARRIQGYVRQVTTHPSAVILTRGPIGSEIPLRRPPGQSKDGTLTTDWDGEELDQLGYVKLDILTIDNLTIINNTIAMLSDDVDFYNLPLDDQLTLDEFKKGHTVGVFQFEEPKSIGILTALEGINFGDISAVNACIRPGLDVARFIHSRNDQSLIEYAVPELEPILSNTYGVILYQEQVMRMCVDLAGFSLGEADKVRKVIAKTANQQDPRGLAPVREKFFDGYIANGHPEDKFDEIWDQILACQTYVFNLAHAVSYAYIAYADMYLKAHYPLEFMCAALQVKSREVFIKECGRLDIEILPPDVNKSEANYTIEDGKIRMGLSCIKHVGSKAKVIISRRPYADEFDFIDRAKPNKKQLSSLAYAGAFDAFDERKVIAKCFREDESNADVNIGELAMGEKDALGFYLEYNPLGDFTDQLARCISPNGPMLTEGVIGGMVSRIKKHEAKTGMMAFGSLLTLDGELDVVVWPSDWATCSKDFVVGNIIIGRAKLTDRGNYSVNSIQVLREA